MSFLDFLSYGISGFSLFEVFLFLLGITHITIISVTVFLHRCQAHRSVELSKGVSHFFRLWLWLTTGMVTKQWAAIHRKHHAKCECDGDPHSPKVYGFGEVLWRGTELYKLASKDNELIHCESKIDDKPLEILVLGHYVYQINIDMLDVLEKASVFTESKLNVTFKPHPLTPIDLNLYPNLKIRQENKSIHEIYSRYDYAYCSSQATASLDAFFLGMKVINFTDPVSLNLHPLYNLVEATFIKDHKQLTLALNEQRNHTSSLSLDDFFYLDGKLHKWLSFIEKELNS